MTGKHHNWHKAWRRQGQRHVHISGVEFTVERGNGFTDINVAPDSLEEFQNYELGRGVPIHDLAKRLMRLAKEAADWHARNPAD